MVLPPESIHGEEIYIGLGDKDLAFHWLHRAIGQKDLAVFLKADPL